MNNFATESFDVAFYYVRSLFYLRDSLESAVLRVVVFLKFVRTFGYRRHDFES